jgi:hypothetical protein
VRFGNWPVLVLVALGLGAGLWGARHRVEQGRVSR